METVGEGDWEWGEGFTVTLERRAEEWVTQQEDSLIRYTSGC